MNGWLRICAVALAAMLLPHPGLSDPVRKSADCKGANFYLPPGTFPTDYPGSDQARRRWYSLALERMNEPSLSCEGWPGAESYRILWLSDFFHPVAIRVTRYAKRYDLIATQLSGFGFSEPGVILYQVRKSLTSEEWERLQSKLAEVGFWKVPTSGNMYGLHGEQWVIEGTLNTAYHVVDRWSPSAGSYRELGRLFFGLAGWLEPAATP